LTDSGGVEGADRGDGGGRRYWAWPWGWLGPLVGEGHTLEATSYLAYGLAACLMWLRTLNFVLVQQDLGQVPGPLHPTLPPPPPPTHPHCPHPVVFREHK
jgi:hypothetical protein